MEGKEGGWRGGRREEEREREREREEGECMSVDRNR